MKHIFNKNIKKPVLIIALCSGLLAAAFFVTTRHISKKSDSNCPPLGHGKASRIVSTSLASDEILTQILGKAGQLDRLVAVSRHADVGAYSHIVGRIAPRIARVGDNLEVLAGLKPDLVIFANFNRPELAAGVARMGAHTCALEHFNSLQEIRSNILAIGAAAGFDSEAAELARTFEQEIKSITDATELLGGTDSLRERRAPRPKVLSFDGSGSVMGARTTFDDLVRLAGGINAAAEAGLSGWPQVNPEAIAGMAPDVIVLIGNDAETTQMKEQLVSLPGWRDTPAVRGGHFATPRTADLLALSPAVLQAVPAIRAAVLQVRNLAMTVPTGAAQ
ncbi:MAG: hypothetical protein RIQ81_2296 [Pseudomonadota bacterium]|jgi:iron complex transport system substrate-binding protein